VKPSPRVAARLTGDHITALFPDVDTPFRDVEDVVNRLLPYHVFQHPRGDLLKAGKGKRKATETEILQSELAGLFLLLAKNAMSFAHDVYRNEVCSGMLQAPTSARGTLSSRPGETWQGRLLLIHSRPLVSLTAIAPQRTASDDQAYYLERQVLDTERAEHSALSTELRNAKSELERLTRLQRVATLPQRTNYYPSAAPVYAHHYRTYHYPYAQTYGAPTASNAATQGYPYSVPLNSAIAQYIPPALAMTIPATNGPPAATTSTSGPPSTPTTTSPLTPAPDTPASAPATSASAMSTAIPVQLPVSSLSTLHALGIVPVPPQALSSNATPPSAILRGTSSNGAMLNLEINVSLLQAAQMSGLALVLNQIMRGSNNTATGEVPPHAQVGAPYTYPYTTAQPSTPVIAATSSPNVEPKKAATQPQGQEGAT